MTKTRRPHDTEPGVQYRRRTLILTGDLSVDTRAAIDALRAWNEVHKQLFSHGDILVRVREFDNGRTIWEPLRVPEMRHALVTAAEVMQKGKEGAPPRAVTPSKALVENILASPDRNFPPLDAIVTTPVIVPDGSVVDTPGYHERHRLYLAPTPGFVMEPVPEKPTEEDVQNAVRLLRDELLGDFPFCGDADRATALAMPITPIVRPMIEGPVPLILLDAPVRGSGKSLLAETVALIATGRPAPMHSLSRKEEEVRKTITSMLLEQGAPIHVFDNVTGQVRSDALAALVTADEWSDRILGESRVARLRSRALFILTGNNIKVAGDLERRCIRCRIDPGLAHPEGRTDFRHPDLRGWTREHRPGLVRAILVLARAWHVAGRPAPDPQLPRMGSFEAWRMVIGGILEFAGVPGLLGNLEELRASVDDETESWTHFLVALHKKFESRAITTAEIYQAVDYGPEIRDALPDIPSLEFRNPTRDKKALGKALGYRVDRRYALGDGSSVRLSRVQQSEKSNSARRWRVILDPGHTEELPVQKEDKEDTE